MIWSSRCASYKARVRRNEILWPYYVSVVIKICDQDLTTNGVCKTTCWTSTTERHVPIPLTSIVMGIQFQYPRMS